MLLLLDEESLFLPRLLLADDGDALQLHSDSILPPVLSLLLLESGEIETVVIDCPNASRISGRGGIAIGGIGTGITAAFTSLSSPHCQFVS